MEDKQTKYYAVLSAYGGFFTKTVELNADEFERDGIRRTLHYAMPVNLFEGAMDDFFMNDSGSAWEVPLLEFNFQKYTRTDDKMILEYELVNQPDWLTRYPSKFDMRVYMKCLANRLKSLSKEDQEKIASEHVDDKLKDIQRMFAPLNHENQTSDTGE